MSKESLRFLLFDTHSKEKLRFTLVELRAFIKTIPKSRLAAIKVQMEGRAEWLSLANFREAKPPEPELGISPDEETTVIELRQNLTMSPRPKVEVKSRAKSSGTNERRRRPRVKIRRRVIIAV